MLATNYGSLCPNVTNFGSQNFGYQIWFCTRLIKDRDRTEAYYLLWQKWQRKFKLLLLNSVRRLKTLIMINTSWKCKQISNTIGGDSPHPNPSNSPLKELERVKDKELEWVKDGGQTVYSIFDTRIKVKWVRKMGFRIKRATLNAEIPSSACISLQHQNTLQVSDPIKCRWVLHPLKCVIKLWWSVYSISIL